MKAAIGRYYNVESPIHALDPRMKIHLLIIAIVGAFLARSFTGLALLLAVAVIVIVLSRVPIGFVGRAIAPFVILFVIPLVFNMFVKGDGAVLFSWGILTLTEGGLYTALFATVRLVVLFLFATIFTLTTSPIEICDATDFLLTPFARFGFPSHEVAMMMSIALRFIPTLQEEFGAIRKAQLSRGATFDEGGPIKRLKGVFPIIVPLFASSIRHAEELACAMESRCYAGGEHRSHYHILKTRPVDWLSLTMLVAIDVAVCFI